MKVVKNPLKALAVALVISGMAVISLESSSESLPIKFYSFEEGFKVAEKEDKLVLVYVHSDTCHVCKAFLEDLSKYEDLQKVFKKFVVVKVDFLRERTLATKLGATGTPEFYVFYPNGTLVEVKGRKAIYIGYSPVPDDEAARKSLIAFLEKVLESAG